MLRPPKGVPAATLWCDLLETPRPRRPLRTRLEGAEDVRLWAWAIKASEIRHGGAEPEGLIYSVIAASLRLDDGIRPFSSGKDLVDTLREQEIGVLAAEMNPILGRISPTYMISSMEDWDETLEKGARFHMQEAFALGSCMGIDGPELDRYFGMPVKDLCDAHWFAFHAARAVLVRMRKKGAQGGTESGAGAGTAGGKPQPRKPAGSKTPTAGATIVGLSSARHDRARQQSAGRREDPPRPQGRAG